MFFQDILITSDQMHLLKLIADHIADQSGNVLADVEGYQVTMKRCLDDMPPDIQPSLHWYIVPLDYGEAIHVLKRGTAAQNRHDKPLIFSTLTESLIPSDRLPPVLEHFAPSYYGVYQQVSFREPTAENRRDKPLICSILEKSLEPVFSTLKESIEFLEALVSLGELFRTSPTENHNDRPLQNHNDRPLQNHEDRPLRNRWEKPSIFSILKEQGFDAIRGIGGMVSLTTEAQESVYRTFVYTTKPYEKAMRMLHFSDDTNFTPPVWMPSELARCTIIQGNPMARFDNFGAFFDPLIMPGEEGVWADVLSSLEKDPHGPKINLREELFVHLGNRAIGMFHYAKPITETSESMVICVELKPDRESAVLAGLEKLCGTDPEMDFSMHKSYKIWHRKLPGEIEPDWEIPDIFGMNVEQRTAQQPHEEPEWEDIPIFPDSGFVVAKNCIFASTDREYLTTILDRLDSPSESAQSTIAGDLEYQAVQRVFSEWDVLDKPRFFQFFARAHETLCPTYEIIRLDQIDQSQALLEKLSKEIWLFFFHGDLFLCAFGESTPVRSTPVTWVLLESILSASGCHCLRIDGSSLPEFEQVQHYFGTVGTYGVTEPDGYFIKGFMLERQVR